MVEKYELYLSCLRYKNILQHVLYPWFTTAIYVLELDTASRI